MDTILVSVVALALIIMSTLTVTVSTFHAANSLTDAWKDMEVQASETRRTEIKAVAADDYDGGTIELSVQNQGNTDLSNYARWDVIIQYQSGGTSHLTYAEESPPEPGEWAVDGIFMTDGSPEVFGLNILNPSEAMTVVVNPETEISAGETVRIVISTPNGVTSQCLVTRAQSQCEGNGD